MVLKIKGDRFLKKLSFLCIMILNIFIFAACGSNNTTQTKSNNSNIEPSASYNVATNKDELKESFQKWDTSTIEESEKELIITNFTSYLEANKMQAEDKLKEISERFKISSLADITVISYIETPEFYGESGKLSYTWVIYNNTVKLIFNSDSKEIEDIIQDKNNKKIYYLIGRDYLITNCTGVFISRITVEENNIEFNNNVIDLKTNDSFNIQEGVLYGKSQLAIQKENADGTQINIKELNGDSSLNLYLMENNSFKG